MSEPKDLKVKMGSEREAAFTQIKANQKKTILESQIGMELAEIIEDYCDEKIAEEKEAFK